MNKKIIALVVGAMATVVTIAGPCGGRGCGGCRPCRPAHHGGCHRGYDWNHGGRQDFWTSFAGAAAGALVGGIVNNATAQPVVQTVAVQQPQYAQQVVAQPVAAAQPAYVAQQQYAQPTQIVGQQYAVNTATRQLGGGVAVQQQTTRVWVPGHYEISQTGGYQTWIAGHYETAAVVQ